MLRTPRKARLLILAQLFVTLMALSATVVLATPAAAHGHRTAPTIIQCYQFRPLLYQGVGGQAGCVAALQGFLQYANHPGRGDSPAIDGIFGPITRDHVVWFQAVHGLHTDGIVGLRTWRVIRYTCGTGATLKHYCAEVHVRY